MKFMILLVRNRYRKNKIYYGNILSLTNVSNNVFINYNVKNVESTRKGLVNKYIFELFSVICFFIAFFILLIRILNRIQKGW